MSSYKAILDGIFRITGGFCVAQTLVPRSYLEPALVDVKVNAPRPSDGGVVSTLRRAVGDLSARARVARTLDEDIAHNANHYPRTFIAAAGVIVGFGGPLAVVGGLCSFCFRGRDGDRRYRRVKAVLNDPSTVGRKEPAK